MNRQVGNKVNLNVLQYARLLGNHHLSGICACCIIPDGGTIHATHNAICPIGGCIGGCVLLPAMSRQLMFRHKPPKVSMPKLLLRQSLSPSFLCFGFFFLFASASASSSLIHIVINFFVVRSAIVALSNTIFWHQSLLLSYQKHFTPLPSSPARLCLALFLSHGVHRFYNRSKYLLNEA